MKVALVGGTASKEDAPWKDPSWRIWTVATAVERCSRVDLLFEIHDRAHWLAHTPDHRRVMRLNSHPVPVMMRETHPDIPRSVRYPLEAVVSRFAPVCPNSRPDYLQSSIDYMLAFAALNAADVEQIGFWGINMTGRTEYGYQLPSCQYWIGILRGMGVPVWIHPTSPLCRMRAQYGTAEWSTPDAQKRYAREVAPV